MADCPAYPFADPDIHFSCIRAPQVNGSLSVAEPIYTFLWIICSVKGAFRLLTLEEPFIRLAYRYLFAYPPFSILKF